MPGATMKVLLLGPCMAGKTALSDFLANATAGPSNEYQPTVALRVHECDWRVGNERATPLELWDCSGDEQYRACWPALMQDADAAVLVYDATTRDQAMQLDVWRKQVSNLHSSRILVLAHRGKAKARLPASLSDVAHEPSSLDDDAMAQGVRAAFDALVQRASSAAVAS